MKPQLETREFKNEIHRHRIKSGNRKLHDGIPWAPVKKSFTEFGWTEITRYYLLFLSSFCSPCLLHVSYCTFFCAYQTGGVCLYGHITKISGYSESDIPF